MAVEERNFPAEISPATRIIDMVDLGELNTVMARIDQFQRLVRNRLRDGLDYGVIPGTGKKPTLYKPGAEKICMLLGLRSEFDIVDSTRDFENGFFQYHVKAKLYRNTVLITEGMGTCNTKERKYIKQDAYSIDNTVLKMAKKRALVDAALMVGSLSDIFTQDLEDMDIEERAPREQTKSQTNRSQRQDTPKNASPNQEPEQEVLPPQDAQARQNPFQGGNGTKPEALASKDEIQKAYQHGKQNGFSDEELLQFLNELNLNGTDNMTAKQLQQWRKIMDDRVI